MRRSNTTNVPVALRFYDFLNRFNAVENRYRLYDLVLRIFTFMDIMYMRFKDSFVRI